MRSPRAPGTGPSHQLAEALVCSAVALLVEANGGIWSHVGGIVPEHYLLADKTFILDVSRARTLLGWRPRYTNVTMTTEAFDWYAANWEQYQPRPGPVLRLLNALS